MMESIKATLQQLNARLPELERKLSRLPVALPNQFPRGLFQEQIEPSAQGFMQDIRTDLTRLSEQKDEQSAYYLAARISQKINVLVHFCQKNASLPKVPNAPALGLQELNTRKRWLKALEDEITALQMQKAALMSRINKDPGQAAFFQLQQELGLVERELTLAEENLHRALR